jgi:hypothetical protein
LNLVGRAWSKKVSSGSSKLHEQREIVDGKADAPAAKHHGRIRDQVEGRENQAEATRSEFAAEDVRCGSFCDMSTALADVCSWGNSRHSIVYSKEPSKRSR